MCRQRLEGGASGQHTSVYVCLCVCMHGMEVGVPFYVPKQQVIARTRDNRQTVSAVDNRGEIQCARAHTNTRGHCSSVVF